MEKKIYGAGFEARCGCGVWGEKGVRGGAYSAVSAPSEGFRTRPPHPDPLVSGSDLEVVKS